jgi:hypothetical protein
MTAKQIVGELRALRPESIKSVLRNSGVREPFLGVKIGAMKKRSRSESTKNLARGWKSP